MLSDTTLQQIKAVPLTDIASQYTRLKRAGSEWVGLCPFHDERTPSFYVHPTKGYKCQGCGEGGANAIDFIKAIEKLSFPDAAKRVAATANIYIDETISQPVPLSKIKEPAAPAPMDIIPRAAIQANLQANNTNNLYAFIVSKYGQDMAAMIFTRYGVGTCKRLGHGTTLFVQQDINGQYRQAKAIAYSPATGKRDKEQTPLIIGKTIFANYTGRPYESINLSQCYFGEHLLSGNTKPVAVVESEKTAMIASLFFPQYVWIATGGKNGARWYRGDVCKVLTGRQVLLFPDADGMAEWAQHAKELAANIGCKATVIDIMNGEPAPEGMEKYDIADLLLQSDKKPDPYINLLNITATHGNTFRQYVSINGQCHQVLFYSNNEPVQATDTESINKAQQLTGLIFTPAALHGFGCMMAKHYN